MILQILNKKKEFISLYYADSNRGGALTQKYCTVCIEQEKHSSLSHRQIYLEKFIANPRHVEVQVVGDGKGKDVLFQNFYLWNMLRPVISVI